MTHKLKVIALAIAAITAVGVVAAPGASATTELFHFEPNIAVTGTQAGVNKFSTPEGKTECPEAQFKGIMIGTEATTVGLVPTFGSCQNSLGSGTVEANGCEYVLHTMRTVEGVTKNPEIDLVCPEGKQIVIKVVSLGVLKCQVTVGEQTGLQGIEFTNKGSGTERSLSVSFNLSGIKYSTKPGEGFGKCTETTNATNGTFSGSDKVTAEYVSSGITWME
jgi:hypothetical protein